MLKELQRSLLAIAALTVVLCGAYPLAVWAIAQVAFPDAAQGSLVTRGGAVVGSRLVGQAFTGPTWFHPRPSASDYAGNASAASNLGPNSADLATAIHDRLVAVAKLEGVPTTSVPADLVTASASGVDPDISRSAALLQVARIARARGVDAARVAALVTAHVDGPTLGLLGATRVNVLDLNLALDALR
jgi:K+-transporting ATPase ATPase C chain